MKELILREVTNRQTETLMVNKLLHMFFHMAVPAWALKSRKPQRIDNKVQKRSILPTMKLIYFVSDIYYRNMRLAMSSWKITEL